MSVGPLEEQSRISAHPGDDETTALRRRHRQIGRYRLGRRLGAGGTASVYMARFVGAHNFERLAAVKVIHEHLAEEREFVSMLLDEANLVVRLSHSNIVHVYELERDGELLYMAMELVQGQPLSKVYRALAERGGRLPFDTLAWIGAQVAEGLHHAHELRNEAGERVGLVHRDVSPDNILVSYEGAVKVIDFGIARAAGRVTTTALGHIKGKYRYMAPEQVLGQPIDHRVDLFALGATLYEGVLGRPVFGGHDDADTLGRVLAATVPHPKDQVPDLPDQLAQVVLRALAYEREERPSDAGALAKELRSYVAASGRVDQREQLANLMQMLFATEQAEHQQAILALRQSQERASWRSVSGRVLTGSNGSESGRPQARRRRWLLPLLVGTGTAAALTAAILTTHRPVPARGDTAAADSRSRHVTLEITWQPATRAVVEVQGREVASRPARATLPRSDQPVLVRVRAAGFDPAEIEVTPSHDRFLIVPLMKARTETGVTSGASTQSPAPGPRPAPSAAPSSQAGAKAPPRSKAAKNSNEHKAPPSAVTRPKSGIVTDYPF